MGTKDPKIQYGRHFGPVLAYEIRQKKKLSNPFTPICRYSFKEAINQVSKLSVGWVSQEGTCTQSPFSGIAILRLCAQVNNDLKNHNSG